MAHLLIKRKNCNVKSLKKRADINAVCIFVSHLQVFPNLSAHTGGDEDVIGMIVFFLEAFEIMNL